MYEILEGGTAEFDERAAPAHSDVGAIVPPHWSRHSTIRLPAWYARFGSGAVVATMSAARQLAPLQRASTAGTPATM